MTQAYSKREFAKEGRTLDGLDMTSDQDERFKPGRSGANPRTAVSLFGHARFDVSDASTQSLQPLREILAPRHDPDRIWADLPRLNLTADQAATRHLILTHRNDPVGRLFDLLRTQLLQALNERGWTRVAICAPTRGCGATFVAANLALALGRRHNGRAVLIDLDLRAPSLADVFGVENPGAMRPVLGGEQPIESHFIRLGNGLALGLNDTPEPDSAELLQSPTTAQSLEALQDDLAPDVILYDLPPLLDSDDVLGFLPEVDGVLLVSDGTKTGAQDILECERLLKDRTTLIGVVLNRAEDRPAKRKG